MATTQNYILDRLDKILGQIKSIIASALLVQLTYHLATECFEFTFKALAALNVEMRYAYNQIAEQQFVEFLLTYSYPLFSSTGSQVNDNHLGYE